MNTLGIRIKTEYSSSYEISTLFGDYGFLNKEPEYLNSELLHKITISPRDNTAMIYIFIPEDVFRNIVSEFEELKPNQQNHPN